MVDLYDNYIQATAILVLLPRLQIWVTMSFVLGKYYIFFLFRSLWQFSIYNFRIWYTCHYLVFVPVL